MKDKPIIIQNWKRLILFSMFIFIFLVCASKTYASLPVYLSDQGTDVKTTATDTILASGNLTVRIYDALVAGNKLYEQNFTEAIEDGTWNVMLNKSLNLEYGKKYWKDYSINDEDLDFDGNERLAFYSPLGDISTEDLASNITLDGNISINGSLNIQKKLNVSGNATAKWFEGLFNWSIVSGFLSFTGSMLDFNSAKLNTTIRALPTGNSTAEIQNAQKYNSSAEIADQIRLYPTGNTTAEIKTVSDANPTGNTTAEIQNVVNGTNINVLDVNASSATIHGDLNVTGKSYLGTFQIKDDLVVGNINISGTSGNLTTAKWFEGLFNWSIVSGFLSFTGSMLDFNSAKLNTTIRALPTGNSTAEIKTVSDAYPTGNSTSEIATVIRNYPTGNSTSEIQAVSQTGNTTAEIRKASDVYVNETGDVITGGLNVSKDINASAITVFGDLNVTGKSYLGTFKIKDDLVVGNINISGTSGNITTAKWFEGLFNWSIVSGFLSFTGSMLDFNSAKLNTTIRALPTGNSTAEIQNAQKYNSSAEIADQIRLYPTGNTSTELSDWLSTNRSSNVTFDEGVSANRLSTRGGFHLSEKTTEMISNTGNITIDEDDGYILVRNYLFGGADDLSTIVGGVDGQIIYMRNHNDGEDVTYKHADVTGGGAILRIAGAADFAPTLDDAGVLQCMRTVTSWNCVIMGITT